MDVTKFKACLICGTPTNCLHYDVISCRGCKQFFRRSYLAGKSYKCKFSNNCNIKKGAKCKACRYKKCVVVGMNPEAIVVDENQKSPPQSQSQAIQVLSPKENDLFHLIPELLQLENRFRELRIGDYKPYVSPYVTTYDLVTNPTNLGRVDTRPIIFAPNDDDFIRFKMHKKMAKHAAIGHGKQWPIVDMILTIEMAKTLPIFEELDTNDKVEILKNVSYVNVLLTQAFYSYLNLQSTIANPDGSLPIQARQKHGTPSHLAEVAFSRILDPFYRINLTMDEYVLLKLLLYCYYPSSSELSEAAKEKLRKEFDKTSKLLLKHMQIQYGTDIGAKKYSEAISLIGTLFHFLERHKEIYLLNVMACYEKKIKKGKTCVTMRWHKLQEEMFA